MDRLFRVHTGAVFERHTGVCDWAAGMGQLAALVSAVSGSAGGGCVERGARGASESRLRISPAGREGRLGRRRGAGKLPASLREVCDPERRDVCADGARREEELQSGVGYGATACDERILRGVVSGVELDASSKASNGCEEGVAGDENQCDQNGNFEAAKQREVKVIAAVRLLCLRSSC